QARVARLADAGHAVVGDAVAVIVDAVAGGVRGLGRKVRAAVLAAGDVGAEVLVARIAGAEAALAVGAGRGGVQRHAHVAAGAAVLRVALRVEALVQVAIAVVVDAVAALDAAIGFDARVFAAGLIGVAIEESRHAFVLALTLNAPAALVGLRL